MSERGAAPLPRVLAPVALALAAVLFIAVLAGSMAGGGGGGESERSAARSGEAASATADRPKTRRSTYTVKTGDTLGGISRKTGISVQRLQELNPELDPQALISGQKLKLR